MESVDLFKDFTLKEIGLLISLSKGPDKGEAVSRGVRRYWDSLSPEGRERRRKINDDRWTVEERDRASQRGKEQWADYSEGRKEKELAKVLLNEGYRQTFAEKRRNMTFEETEEWIGRSFNRPSVREVAVENMRIGLRKWWAGLSKERKEAEITKRVAASAKSSAIRPSRIEVIVLEYLEERYPGEWAYNGDYSQGILIGRRIPDFINVNGKKSVIEVFGSYWHLMDDPEAKIAHYKKYGFDCKVIWEWDCVPGRIDKVLVW